MTVPHIPYIAAVLTALTAAGLAPTDSGAEAANINPYDNGPDAGLTTMLDAVMVWNGQNPAVNTAEYPHGIALVWEHPAESWQWAAQQSHGRLEREPAFLPSLPRWAAPAAVVTVVQALLAGRPVPEATAPLWEGAAEAQAAVDAWWAAEAGGDR
ncbi:MULTISPECIES: hypothetical protein [Streptomycetaceae]|uniref:Uncharacterized protein n=1 Tax=Streptantibioticus cattleyicolor (strain ATCC 35852 / DSM 46488 / JCM 4925 / NBRC 14057 / NRRL 8057) TaxID=1003195 RepID=G8WPE5_STREN|nr:MULTISPECIES: hypothetical protein [Streptomycetaceae]AEW94647.1 hypothetical protein SCATT_22760 [Streptantibioticus cattleyicolor NRRL 8057 = DSM 46488]MYS59285.1 hypothetical protein [Streptomyces sp. SID5468]